MAKGEHGGNREKKKPKKGKPKTATNPSMKSLMRWASPKGAKK